MQVKMTLNTILEKVQKSLQSYGHQFPSPQNSTTKTNTTTTIDKI
jgi:hypothetical protein